MSLTCRLYRDGLMAEEDLDPERISDVLQEEGALVWLDVEDPTPQNMEMLAEEFNLHELAIEDCLQPHQRPKIEQYEGYFFLVAYGVTLLGEDDILEHEMAAFVSKRYLITVRKDPVYDLSRVTRRWNSHTDLAGEGGGYLLYILLDEIVDGYFDVLDRFDERTDDLETMVFGGGIPPETQSHIFRLKKELLTFRHSVAPLRDVLDVMQRRIVDVVTVQLEPYYRDVYDHVLRATDFIDTIRDILSSALDAHLAVVSNNLNEVMKKLTSWAAIILIPTLIAGIYGMNFRHMPELEWRYGYPMALGVMGLLAFVLYRVFKGNEWL